MILKLIYFSCLLVLCNCASISSKKEVAPSETMIKFKLSSWTATIDPISLTVYGQKGNDKPIKLTESHLRFQKPVDIKGTNKEVSFRYPDADITISIYQKNDRLHFIVTSKKEYELQWPIMGTDPSVRAIILPDGEGLYIPISDPFWHRRLTDVVYALQGADISGGGLIAPFFGYDLGNQSVSFIIHSDLDNQLYFEKSNNRLIQKLAHTFSNQNNDSFEMSITLTENSPMAPAFNFRRYLLENDKLRSLKDKIKENPQIAKLSGAMHAYMWGDGRTIHALDELNKLGISRMWIGYEDKPHRPPRGKWVKKQHYVLPEYIEKAKNYGYLVGPYDSFHTMVEPKKAESANEYFIGQYPSACIRLKNQKPDVGFAGRGCHTSSEAFALEQPKNNTIYRRVSSFTNTGINTYFLDCDATGELFDDYSTAHPMNKQKDRINRLERMSFIAHDKSLVLGSETAAAWAVNVLAFAHGNVSTHNNAHWELTRRRDIFGTWWPPERPAFFFKKVNPPSEYVRAKYDPAYRLPLFQAVFHDALVTTDRWEISHMKYPNLVTKTELFELLYGVAPIWSLDMKEIKEHRARLKKLSEFFSELHNSIFLEPLSEFLWLSEDRLLQQTTFGNKVRITANFSSTERNGIPAQSIQAVWLADNKILTDRP